MATISSRYPMAQNAGELTRRTTLGVLAAIVDALALSVGATGQTSPFAAAPVVASTAVSGVGAGVAYAALGRLTDRPVRNFVAVSALVFVGMLVPVLVIAPTLGVTGVGQAVLVALHVVAVPLVAFVVGAVRL